MNGDTILENAKQILDNFKKLKDNIEMETFSRRREE
jgi:hypothetical protein